MMRINVPFATKVMRGLVFAGLMVAALGLSPLAEARPLTRSLMVSDHQFSSDAAPIKLVDARDHDADASADHPTTEMSPPKKKTEKSMKEAPDAKNQSSQKHRKSEQHGTKESKSAPSDEQLSLKEANDKPDRPDDRRQGKNLERKP
jgi:hypothetical protein